MILLLGGTSELYPLSQELLNNGLEVLVSTATNIHINLPQNIKRRCGRLTTLEMISLCSTAGIKLIIDAGHPFASILHLTCVAVSTQTSIPLLRLIRPPSDLPLDIAQIATHEQAAAMAFSCKGPVLLTIGSQNLTPYVLCARQTKLPILARILDYHESINACLNLGLTEDEFIVGRGPFNVQTNADLIRKYNASVLVSKDSGQPGGLYAKIEAAKKENCKVIIVTRQDTKTQGFYNFYQLAKEAHMICNR
jgi:precorrin-6A/cobalt-precorrin-6A reductase